MSNPQTPQAGKGETMTVDDIRIGHPIHKAAREAMDQLYKAMADRGTITTMMYDFGTRPVIAAILKCLSPAPSAGDAGEGMAARLAALEAERDRLAAIVEKLPVTADNVPILAGMNIIALYGIDGKTIRDDVGVIEVRIDGSVEDFVIRLRSSDGDEWDTTEDYLFSTVEAARAALATPSAPAGEGEQK